MQDSHLCETAVSPYKILSSKCWLNQTTCRVKVLMHA